MENFLSLLESVDPLWLTPSSTTWAMDMILAFVCGLGLFRLLLPLLPLDSPSPTPAENNIPQKVVRKEHRKVRKKIRTVKVYRGSRKKPKEDKVLSSLLHSIKERLVNSISICRHLGQKASGEAFKPDDTKAHLSPREPTGKSVATKSSLETSSVPSKEHLLLKDSKHLSPVLPNSSPIESQSSVSASWPPETLTTGRRHSPPQQWAPSYPSHPRDPVACPPSMPNPSMATPHIEWEILATSQSHILPGLPSPMPTTPETNLSRRPTSTTPGHNYPSRSTSTRPDLDHLSRPTSNTPGLNDLSRSTSTRPELDHLSRPTSTTSGLDPFSRPTSTIPGLEHPSRPISGPFMYQITSRTLCHSTSSPDESLQEDLSLTIHKTSYWTGPTDRQREAGKPSFISPVIQEMPEAQIRQRVQLKVSTGKIKGRSDLYSSCTGSMLHSCSSKETTITAHTVWSKEFKLEQFSGHQRVLTHELKEECVQFYWGLPWLHSESLVAHVSVAGSPLDPPSILFNGLSTYSPLDTNTKGLPQLCSPKSLLPHLVKSQPLSPKFPWSRTPSETRLQAKAHDPSSLSKLPCDSAPIRKDGASRITPSGAKFIVSPKVQHLEHHLLKKYQESRCDLPVMVKRSLEAFNQQTFKSWGTHNSPVLQPALLRQVEPNNNSVPSEAPTTAQAFNVTSMSTPKCLVGRSWHRNTVVRSSGEYPEPNPCRVQGVWEPPESEVVTLRQNYHHGVSVREISEASQSSYSRDTRELEDTEEEESSNWTRATKAGKMGDVPVYQLLEINGNLASPSKTYSQDADDSSLSSAAGLALRDCSPGKVCQDWAPEILLAADILASRTSRSTFKMEPTTTKAPFLDRSSLSSRGRSVHKNCRLQGLQHNHSCVKNMKKI